MFRAMVLKRVLVEMGRLENAMKTLKGKNVVKKNNKIIALDVLGLIILLNKNVKA